jgi:hypothetical protein
LGRGKVNKEIEVDSVKALHKEIQKHLASKNWDMYESDEPNVYVVDSGWNRVGKVKLIESIN